MLNLLVLVLMFTNLAEAARKPPIHNSVSFHGKRLQNPAMKSKSDKRYPKPASFLPTLCLFTVTHNVIIPFYIRYLGFLMHLSPHPLWKKKIGWRVCLLFVCTQSFMKRCLSCTREDIWFVLQKENLYCCLFWVLWFVCFNTSMCIHVSEIVNIACW